MKKLLTAILLTAVTATSYAGVKDGTVTAGADLGGYGYGLESHNKRFQESEYYAFAIKAEYVAFAFSDYAIGFQPYFGFGVGTVNMNPIIMGNLIFHVMRQGIFDPYIKLGAGVSRVSENQDLTDPDGTMREYTVSTAYFDANAGLGATIWIKRVGITVEGYASFLERTNFAVNGGVIYKLRTGRKGK